MREKLRALRLESGLTQKELAAKLNSTDKSIWNYENGIATPPYEVLIAYTKFFDVSADYLLGLEDDFGARTATGGNVMRDTNTAQERELLALFRTLSPYLQGLTLDTVRGWAGNAGNSLHKKA